MIFVRIDNELCRVIRARFRPDVTENAIAFTLVTRDGDILEWFSDSDWKFYTGHTAELLTLASLGSYPHPGPPICYRRTDAELTKYIPVALVGDKA